MKMIKQENIVELKEVLASRTKIFMVLELVTGGELFDKIVSEERLSEEKARKFFQQLIAGVRYCHAQGVCHRDLKPENLLLSERDSLKISDFGLSALYKPGEGGEGTPAPTLLHTTCGTPNYVAPEVLSDKGYDGKAADVWSCGVILYVLLAGFLPFDEMSVTALFKKISRADYTFPKWFSDGAKNLIAHILVADPAKRLTTAQIIRHPWFTEGGSAVLQEPVAMVAPSTDEVFQETAEISSGQKKIENFEGMNAFDFIMSGQGLDLSGMFEKAPQRRPTCWISNYGPDELLAAILERLPQLDGTFFKPQEGRKIRITVTGKHNNHVLVQVHITKLLGTNHGVAEFRRLRGDPLEFCDFLKRIQKLCRDLKQSARDEDD
eukprot:TRINITY_DN814_c0_g1::TRINITY_DN814_c0_g1_i1::g.25335::m.25335 TRINITY_DN814_c0_g1::TRINITY_DN814_c0_g1_i1::g.25335  ORF type:complete len:379 (-),score=92.84,sp/Q6X4A2/CIPKV_ORYSJ/45.28/8e-99,Pkinase/PF00069.20/1.1e-58,Pkinase_Tyr/PF07714.12/5e-28,NAF/PF03822.9/2.1e-07,Kinase-like/PF14531.1/5.8e-06,Kdo/PF06293.9/0.0012,APH/PF01636.18/0.039,APH/PF01636.18/1.4e+03,Choline_kinase/PF01633.15/0.15 TRINITY_DN814_c0_g1_i1:527-1663(-)